MGIFDRFRRSGLSKLERFASSHEGVEGYVEPRTGIRPQSLLLVDRAGEWTRAPITDRRQAEALCKGLGLPLYDAAVVGYPDRMRSRGRKEVPATPSAQELEEWFGREDQ